MNEKTLLEGIEKINDLKTGPCYLVGGYIRNLLTGRRNADADIVTNDETLAEKLAVATGADYFTLKDGFFRRVLKGGVSWDFTPLGKDINENLRRRDFRCDALALDIRYAGEKDPSSFIIDPFWGLDDIRTKTVSPVSESVFRDDPVRVLRAFRIVSQGGLSMSRSLKELIKRDRHLLADSKGERLWDEIKKIAPSGSENSLLEISRFYITKAIHSGARDPEEVNEIMKRAKLFRDEKLHADPVFAASALWSCADIPGRFKFSSEEKKLFRSYTEKSADIFSCWLYAGGSAERIFRVRYSLTGYFEYMRALEKHGHKVRTCLNEPLLSGEEIMEIKKIETSPKVGALKKRLLKEQFFGKIKTKDRAREFVKKI